MENNNIKNNLSETLEKGTLLKKAILIIERLSKNRLADTDMDGYEQKDVNEIKELILKSRELVGSRWWKNLISQ